MILKFVKRMFEFIPTDVFLYNMRPTILYCRKTNSTGELRSSIYEMNKKTGLTAKIRLFSKRKELLDDDEMHYRYKQISVVYGKCIVWLCCIFCFIMYLIHL